MKKLDIQRALLDKVMNPSLEYAYKWHQELASKLPNESLTVWQIGMYPDLGKLSIDETSPLWSDYQDFERYITELNSDYSTLARTVTRLLNLCSSGEILSRLLDLPKDLAQECHVFEINPDEFIWEETEPDQSSFMEAQAIIKKYLVLNLTMGETNEN